MEYANKGAANTALGFGIAGLASNFLNGGLGNVLGMGNCRTIDQCSDNMPINRYELNMVQENSSLKSENALLRADKYTDEKIIEAYKDLVGQFNQILSNPMLKPLAIENDGMYDLDKLLDNLETNTRKYGPMELTLSNIGPFPLSNTKNF